MKPSQSRLSTPVVRLLSTASLLLTAIGCLHAAEAGNNAADKQGAGVTVYPKIDRPEFNYDVPNYTLSANGQEIPIRNYDPHDTNSTTRSNYYAHFGMPEKGKVTIIIDAKEEITSFKIRPNAYDIKGTVKGTKLGFTLEQSRYLAVEINGRKDLFILADPNETDRPSSSGTDSRSGKAVFNISKAPYSADGTGKKVATDAIKQAIEDAAKDEKGGIVYVPAGQYLTSGISLKNRVWLYLEPGAVLVADPDRTKWGNSRNPSAMINCRNIIDAKIYGRGVIYCRSVEADRELKKLKESQPEVYGSFRTLRLRPFEISGVTNFMIDGVLVNESSAWTIYIQKGKEITVANTKVVNAKVHSGTNDGINIGGGSKIHIRHCFVTTLDDAVCLKGIYGEINGVVLEDMVADSARSQIKFGMQGLAAVVDVTVRDFHGTAGAKGLDISHDMGQADYRKIRFFDSSFDRNGYPLRITIRDDASNWGGKGRGVASVVGVEFNNVDFYVGEGKSLFRISGYDPDNIARDLVFQNVRVNGKLLTDSDIGQGEGKLVTIGPYVANVKVQGTELKLAPWPPKKAVESPPPSKSRAGKAWEEAQAAKKEAKP